MTVLYIQNRQYEDGIASSRVVPPPLSHNPLPPPPEPVNFDQFAHWPDYNTPYSAPDPKMGAHVDHTPYNQRAHLYPSENGYSGSDPSLTSSRDRKGKGKAREADQPHSYTVHAPSSWGSQIAETEVNQPSVSVPGPSIAIIPGAPPDKRFKPPARSVPEEQYYSQGHEARWDEEPTQVVQPPTPSSLQPGNRHSHSLGIDPYPLFGEYIINGYANGFSAGYNIATERDPTNPLSESSKSRPRSSRTQLPPSTLPSGASAPTNPAFREHSPPRTKVAQQPAAVSMTPLPSIPSNSALGLIASPSSVPMTAPLPSIPPNSALGLIPSSPSSNATPAPAHGRAFRRSATQPIVAMTTVESSATTYVPSSVTERPTNLRRLSTGIPTQVSTPHGAIGNRVSLASMSSWGTVNTGNPISPSRLPITEDMLFQRPDEIRSVSDLRLHSFGDADVGGQRASVAYSIESLATGVEAVQLTPEDNLPRQRSQEEVGERDRDRDNTTPRAQTASLRPGSQATARPQDRRQRQHHQDRRHGTYPSSLSQTAPAPLAPPIDHATPASASSGRSSRPLSQASPTLPRSRQHRRHESSSRRQETIPSEVIVEDVEYAGAGDGPPGNALGLSHIFEISAPTPRVPSAPYVRSWNEEDWQRR